MALKHLLNSFPSLQSIISMWPPAGSNSGKTSQIGDVPSASTNKSNACNISRSESTPTGVTSTPSTSSSTVPSISIHLAELDRVKSSESLISKGSKDSFDRCTYDLLDFADLSISTKPGLTKAHVPPSSGAVPVKSRRRPRSASSVRSQASIMSTGFGRGTSRPVGRSISQESFASLSSVTLDLAPSPVAQSSNSTFSSSCHVMSQFNFYSTPIYHSSTDTSSLSGILDDTHFVRLLNRPLQVTLNLSNGELVGVLSLVQLISGTVVTLPVRYCSNRLGVSTTFGTLAQVGLHPAHGPNPQEQTIADMAISCRQSLMIRLSLFSTQLANQLQFQGYPYMIVPPEQVIHVTARPTSASNLPQPPLPPTDGDVTSSLSSANSLNSAQSWTYSYPRFAFLGQPTSLPQPSNNNNPRSQSPMLPSPAPKSTNENRSRPQNDSNKGSQGKANDGPAGGKL